MFRSERKSGSKPWCQVPWAPYQTEENSERVHLETHLHGAFLFCSGKVLCFLLRMQTVERDMVEGEVRETRRKRRTPFAVMGFEDEGGQEPQPYDHKELYSAGDLHECGSGFFPS